MDPFILRPLFSPSPSAQLWPLSLSQEFTEDSQSTSAVLTEQILGRNMDVFNCLPLLSTLLSRKFLKRLVGDTHHLASGLCTLCLFCDVILGCNLPFQGVWDMGKMSETEGTWLVRLCHLVLLPKKQSHFLNLHFLVKHDQYHISINNITKALVEIYIKIPFSCQNKTWDKSKPGNLI